MIIKERRDDLPRNKDAICSELFGEFVGFVKSFNLTEGVEFAKDYQEVFQTSRRILWIDELSDKFQMTVYVNSLSCLVEFGVVRKSDKQVIKRRKIDDLRYKLSSNEKLELIEAHKEQFENLFNEFKENFNEYFKEQIDERKKKITIPFEEGKRFSDGEPMIERDDFFGIMINQKAVFISKEYATEVNYDDDTFSCVLPMWYVEKKSLEIFIDTSDEPSLF